MAENRKMMRYAVYRIDLPESPGAGALDKQELIDYFESDLPVEVHTYSTVGLKANAHMLLWILADEPRDLQEFEVGLNKTSLGRQMFCSHSFLAMTKPSQYLGGHKHEGQEGADRSAGPVGGSYLFVYPMVKKREWYSVPFEERRKMMGEHFKVGHKYPGITIHTGYSFGIDDQEFVVAFEGESVGEFLDLVQELRESAASRYTERETPIFTAVRAPLKEILDQIVLG